jgi:hypothetical protein
LLYKAGNPSTLTVSIKAVDGDGKPTGADLTSGTTNGNTLPTGSPYEWRAITLTQYWLEPETKYAIVCRALEASSPNEINWRSDSSSPSYTGGSFVYSQDAGSTWTVVTGTDCMFEVWGSPPPVAHTVTISESVGFSDSSTRKAGFKQAISESLGLSDSTLRHANFKQAITEKLGLTDSITENFKYKVHEMFKTIMNKIKRYNGY